MENDNRKTDQQGKEAAMDASDWKSQMQPATRRRVLIKITETLKRKGPFSGSSQEALNELKIIAEKFEERIYSAATSQNDYLRKISLKLYGMENKSQRHVPNALPTHSAGNSNRDRPPDPGAHGMPSQGTNQAQVPLPAAQACQQLLSQNVQNNIGSAGVQTSASLPSLLLPVTGVAQTPVPNLSSQNSNRQNISTISQNPAENSTGQGGVPSNIAANSQRQLPGRQQCGNQQQQQQPRNPQQSLHQKQLQQQFCKHKLQQGNTSHSLRQSLIQQQQNLSQPTQLHSPQASVIHQQKTPIKQHQRLIGTHYGNSSMPNNQLSAPSLQQSKFLLQQQTQYNAPILLQTQGKQPQPQMPQQQLMSHIQPQTAQLQQRTNSLQQDGQLKIQASDSLLQSQIVTDQQKQLYQSQRAIPESSSTSLDSTAQTGDVIGGDGNVVYQKIKSMKEMYSAEINEMYRRVAIKLQQHRAHPQQQNQYDKMQKLKTTLEQIIALLQISNSSISPALKKKVDYYEKQIVSFISAYRLRKTNPSLQQGQLTPPHEQFTQQLQSQSTQVQSHENETNPQLQLMNLQDSVGTMQQNNMTSLQHKSMSPISNVSTAQQNTMNSLQSGSNLDRGHGYALSSLQQVAAQQNLVDASQQENLNTLSSQGGVNVLQQNINSLQTNSHMLQQQLLKQHQEQKMSQMQQFKQNFQQQRHMMQQQQQQQQQLHQQAKQDLHAQSQTHKMPQLHRMEVVNDIKMRHGMAYSQSPPAPSLIISTPGISASPLLAEFTGSDGTNNNALATVSGKSSVTEQPFERLTKAVNSLSPEAFCAAVCDIGSVVSMIDRIAGSAPGNGSRAAVGEDLVALSKCHQQLRNYVTQDGASGSKKLRCCTSVMPLNTVSSVGSVNDSCKKLIDIGTSDLESTETSSRKRPRIEANHVLSKEIWEINQQLIDTVIEISNEYGDPTAATAPEGVTGTLVKCSFSAVALSPNLKSQFVSSELSPIQPLRLLVPSNYPICSPVILNKFPLEVSKESEDLSVKTESKFSISLLTISQPMSLGDIARTWDDCARAVIIECAQKSGGGNFSSKYGTWENCLRAA